MTDISGYLNVYGSSCSHCSLYATFFHIFHIWTGLEYDFTMVTSLRVNSIILT